MLRLISYNIHYGDHLSDIFPWIEQQKTTDIICFQEFPAAKRTDFYKQISGVWDHRYTNSFTSKKKIYGMLTLIRRDKITFIRSKILQMGSHPAERSVFKNTLERSCLITTLRVGQKTFTIANAHLVCLATNRARYKQIKMIISALSTTTHPTIITGDLNMHSIRPNKRLIARMNTSGFTTLVKRLVTHRLGIMRHQLDHVYGSGCTIVSLEAPRVPFSDHYPVIAEVRL